MKNALLFAAAVSLLAVVAHAAGGPPASDRTERNKLTVTNLYVEPKANCAYDFPALSDPRIALAITCAESFTCTANGARIGDSCLAASNLGADGGSALATTAVLSCRAVTDGVVFKLCNFTTDAGSYDLADAGLIGRVIH